MSSQALGTPPSLLEPERLSALDRVLDGLDSTSLGFIAGYVTARARADAGRSALTATAEHAARRMTVLYGSQTGNGRRLAERLGRQAEEAGIPVRVLSASDYSPRELATEKLLILFISTHGDGDPPDDARGLIEFLHGRRAPRLEQLSVGVFALGDSSYPKFCETGRAIESRLIELGAGTLLARAEADGDPEATAEPWLADVLCKGRATLGVDSAAGARTLRLVSPAAATATRDAPATAEVVVNQLITGRGATREVHHLELALAPGLLAYQPGDSLGVWLHNPPRSVDRLLALVGATGDETVRIGDRERSLRDWLRDEREITRLSRPLLEAHAARAGDEALKRALEPGQAALLRPLLTELQVADLLSEYPAPWSPQELVAALRPLTPRLYSIASSQASVGDEVHLTVALLEDSRNGVKRTGAASGYLAHEATEGSTVRVYVEPNPRFRLPRDPAVDVIMIGPGTGIAPFRAFIQDRAQSGAGGRNWLFFGARHFDTEFLYQVELQEHLRRGALTRLDVAFSRDQEHKIYVQQRLLEQAADLWQWLEAGAAVYVCGDGERMAPDVHVALRTIVATQGHLSEADAEAYLTALGTAKRYLRDVY